MTAFHTFLPAGDALWLVVTIIAAGVAGIAWLVWWDHQP